MDAGLTLQELLLAILLVLILVFLFILLLLLYSFREQHLLVNRQQWKQDIDQYLLGIIVEGESISGSSEQAIQGLMKQEEFRRFFMGQLIESERKFSGVTASLMQDLFLHYQLDLEAFRLLRSKKRHLVCRGIQALTLMRVEKALPEIKAMLPQAHPQINQEVQYAMLYFEGFKGLSFLDIPGIQISSWQQLRILHYLKKLPEDAQEHLTRWVLSDNEAVISLSLKIIRKFQILELQDLLFTQLSKHSRNIQTEMISCLFHIESPDTISRLLTYYPQASKEQQWQTLRELGHHRALDQLDFLQAQLLTGSEKEIKLLAAESLANLGQLPYLLDLQKKLEPSDSTHLLLNHALQQRIG